MDLSNVLIIKSVDAEEVLRRLFRVSLKEVDDAKQRYPDKANFLHEAMKLTAPTTELMLDIEAIYRSHVREILQRIGEGQDTRLATKAEMLCVLVRYMAERDVGPVIECLTHRLAVQVLGNDNGWAPAMEAMEALTKSPLLGLGMDMTEEELREGLMCPTRIL